MRLPNVVIRPVLLPYIRFNRDMTLAKETTPCNAVRSTQVILVPNNAENTQMACTKYGLKPEQARVGHIEVQCACPIAATQSQEPHTCYSSDVPFYNSFFIDT